MIADKILMMVTIIGILMVFAETAPLRAQWAKMRAQGETMFLIRRLVIAATAVATPLAANPAFSGPATSEPPIIEDGGGGAVPTYSTTQW
jgi:hypothetical protein